MGTFEILVWMVMIAVLIGLGVGGIAVVVGMAAEAWESDARRLKQWVRAFFAAHKEAGT